MTDIKDKIDEFHRPFYTNYVIQPLELTTFKPKSHNIYHYTKYVKNAGPMNRFKCFRFEKTHQLHKRCDQSSNNFKNKALSIATTYSLSFDPKYKEINYEMGRRLNRNSFRRSTKTFGTIFQFRPNLL